jgi:putative MATE family efflux protein
MELTGGVPLEQSAIMLRSRPASGAILLVVMPEIRREIIKIAVPVSLETVFQVALGFVNQVIVGTLGTATIAAVGLANNVLFIGILCLNVLGSGCSILTSQALGRGDQAAVSRIASLSLAVALLVSSAIAVPLSVFATPFLASVGADPEIAVIAGPYLGLMALTLPLITLSVVASSVFRAIGQPRVPMVVTIAAVALTPFLAWWLVIPLRMGAPGAALAGVITQGLRALVMLGLLFLNARGIRFAWPDGKEARVLLKSMVSLTWPLFVTEILFSGGIFLYALMVERLGTPELAAFQIVAMLENVFITASFGLNAAATILVAKAIGRADRSGIWLMSNSILKLGVLSAAGFGVLFAATGFLLPVFFPNTTPGVQSWAFWAIMVSAVFQVVKVSNMIFFGVISSGGDTRFLLLSDFLTVFVLGLPAAYLLAFTFHWGFWGVILGRVIAEETLRVGMFFWRYKTGVWFKLEPADESKREIVLT